jgi:hypothetical protein
MELANLLCVKAAFASLRKTLRRFALTRKFCQPVGKAGQKTPSLPGGKEVRRMKYFKITKTWAVKAESETEAVKLVVADPEKYLDAETVTRTEYKKRQPQTGWGNTIKDQLLGSNSKQ